MEYGGLKMNVQELHTVPRRTWVIVQEDDDGPPGAPAIKKGDRIFFNHIDGMYSFCYRMIPSDMRAGEEISQNVHLKAWTKVVIDESQD
jgi:hypothetical protein